MVMMSWMPLSALLIRQWAASIWMKLALSMAKPYARERERATAVEVDARGWRRGRDNPPCVQTPCNSITY